MHAPVYTSATLIGKQLPFLAVALSFDARSRGPAMPRETSADATVMLSIRVSPEMKRRLSAIAAETGLTIQSIGRQALEIELTAREEMLVGRAEREERIRRRVRSGEAH